MTTPARTTAGRLLAVVGACHLATLAVFGIAVAVNGELPPALPRTTPLIDTVLGLGVASGIGLILAAASGALYAFTAAVFWLGELTEDAWSRIRHAAGAPRG